MEQPLPMSGSLQDQQFPDTKPIMPDMPPFSMANKIMSEGGFSMSNMQGDMRDMISHHQDFHSPGENISVNIFYASVVSSYHS